jgi:alkylation response protein AidB-like acyl-CoA dehydrogenase
MLVHGEVGPVLGAEGTSHLLLAARVSDGEMWFVIGADQPGVYVAERPALDFSRPLATVRLQDVLVPPEGLLGELRSAHVRDLAATLCAAEAAGVAGWCLRTATDYARVREQFGQPIGSFQAIQHACANMLSDVEGAWLTTYRAAWSVATGQADVAMSAAIAKAWTSEASSRVVSMCQQVSGAMGFTREYDAQLYFRRQKRAELFWGDADFHREVVASLLESAD